MDTRYVEFPNLGYRVNLGSPYISIGSFDIYYYGIIITIGLILGMSYAFKNFRKIGVDPDLAIDAILGGIIGGILGARLYYVIFSWSDFGIDWTSSDTIMSSLFKIINPRQGGMAIYGGIIGALAVGLIIAKMRKINMKALLDPIGITFLIGQGIGRWGNFINIEAFGSNTDGLFGMTSPYITNYLYSKLDYFESVGIVIDPYMPVHPCFLYESVWCLTGAFFISRYLDKRKFDGEIFLMYVGYYGLGRFFIERLRTDSLMIGSLRVSQVLAMLLFITSVVIILTIRSKIKANNDETYLQLFATTEEGLLIVNGEGSDTKNQKSNNAQKEDNDSKEDEITETEEIISEEETEKVDKDENLTEDKSKDDNDENDENKNSSNEDEKSKTD